MNNVILTNKPIRITPLTIISKLRSRYHELQSKRIGYAGRLDPMAEGLLLLLVEPETKNRDAYQKLDKVYEFEVLFGVATDSYDVLGIVKNSKLKAKNDNSNLKSTLTQISQELKGSQKQQYPPYSSARVKGKPLFWWAREGKLQNIQIPNKQIEIYDMNLLSLKIIEIEPLKRQITNRIQKVKGDFRQKLIIKSWNKFFDTTKRTHFHIAKFTINCSSGTYVRGIANDIGKTLGTGAIAFSIKRTQIGDFKLQDAIFLP